MKKTLPYIAFLLLAGSLFGTKARSGFSPALLKKVFSILKKSDLKYEFKAVTSGKLRDDKTPESAPVFNRSNLRKIRRITSLQDKSDFKTADLLLRQLLRNTPGNPYFLFLAAKNALGKKNRGGALQLLKKSLLRDRTNQKAWKLLSALTGKSTDRHPIKVAAGIRKMSRTGIQIRYDRITRTTKTHYAWLTYAMCRALWRFEGAFRDRYPAARWYRPSFEETLFCYRALIFSWTRTRLKHPGTRNRDLDFLLTLDKKGLLPGWLLIHAYGEKISRHNTYLIQKFGKSFRNYLNNYMSANTTDK